MDASPKPSLRGALAFALTALWGSDPVSAAGGPGSPTPISILMPDSNARPLPDSARSEEAVKLSAQGMFATEKAAAGDTVEYRLRVEWKDMQIPVVVLAPESLETPGFHVAGQSATHRKTAENGEVRNVTEFAYKLVPKAPGSARVASLKLRYLTGLSSREEALYVPGAFLDIAPAKIPLRDRGWFRALLLAGFAVAAIMGGLSAWKAAQSKRQRTQNSRNKDFAPSFRALKGRWNTAESRAWIEDAERLSCEFLGQQLGAEAPASARFDALLDLYLGQSPTKANGPEEIAGWDRLRDLFRHARYAGGRKEPHELQDAYRVLKTCLHITGEEEP